MLLSIEKDIVNKKFLDLNNKKKIWSYCRKTDPTSQINFELVKENNCKKYRFSFPLKDSPIHYVTYFNENDTEKMTNYVKYIIRHYI